MFQPTCSSHCLSLSVTRRLTQSLFGSLVLAVLHVLSALCQVEKYRFRGMGKKEQPRAQQRKSDRTSGRQKDHRLTKSCIETAVAAVVWSDNVWQLDKLLIAPSSSCQNCRLRRNIFAGVSGLAMGNQTCCAKSNDEKAWGCLDFELCRQQHCDTGSLFLVRFLRWSWTQVPSSIRQRDMWILRVPGRISWRFHQSMQCASVGLFFGFLHFHSLFLTVHVLKSSCCLVSLFVRVIALSTSESFLVGYKCPGKPGAEVSKLKRL